MVANFVVKVFFEGLTAVAEVVAQTSAAAGKTDAAKSAAMGKLEMLEAW